MRRRRDGLRRPTEGGGVLTLAGDERILIRREFDAPRALVYRAWTEPELVQLWWHADRGTITAAEIDLRVGGRWRYVIVTDDGRFSESGGRTTLEILVVHSGRSRDGRVDPGGDPSARQSRRSGNSKRPKVAASRRSSAGCSG